MNVSCIICPCWDPVDQASWSCQRSVRTSVLEDTCPNRSLHTCTCKTLSTILRHLFPGTNYAIKDHCF